MQVYPTQSNEEQLLAQPETWRGLSPRLSPWGIFLITCGAKMLAVRDTHLGVLPGASNASLHIPRSGLLTIGRGATSARHQPQVRRSAIERGTHPTRRRPTREDRWQSYARAGYHHEDIH
eukprot:scaffold7346_cov245-Pinguiococcus_pyrenoidosus.AAC.22